MEDLFYAPDLLERLEGLDPDGLDSLPFGVVAMTTDGNVTGYNEAEASLSGLTPSRVIGRHFFTSVAPCTNNYLVAQRFETESALDLTIDYVFTLRMAPTPVHLRLLKHPDASRMYLVVRRRDDAAA
ncbi:MAG: PAS domain-containing protein [Hyphomonas sp.]